MILISHRGNIRGSNPKLENKPSYIDEAINNEFEVEIDIWYENGLWSGHDKPQYKISNKWFSNNIEYLWVHCKNIEALYHFSFNYVNYGSSVVNYFWHQNDNFTLTSCGYIWTYPRQPLTKASICVMPEIGAYTKKELEQCFGICSDKIEEYK